VSDDLLRGAIVDYTQSEYADRAVELYGDRFRYIPPEKLWLYYDGQRWREDQYDAAFHFVETMCREINEETPASIESASGGTKNNPLKETTRARCNAASIEGVCRIMRTKRPIVSQRHKFDPDPYLFNTPIGTFDFRDNSVHPHTPDDMITKLSGGIFDLDAPEPALFRFYFDEVQSPEWQEQIWRALGYSASGIPGEYIFLHTGSGGNGKSTLLDCVEEALGDYADEISWKVLHSAGIESHDTIFEDLLGKRLAISHLGSRVLSSEALRLLVSETSIKARGMHKDIHTFPATHTFHVTVNNPPPMLDLDASIRRRVLVIPWNVTVNKPNLALKHELPQLAKDYVLTQILLAASRWQASEFPESATQEQFRKNVTYAFASECCEMGPGYRELTETLYAAAKRWAIVEDVKLPSEAIFGRTLSRTFGLQGYRTSGTTRRKGWEGIQLKANYKV
jgi:putative DNA primase/helicase